MGEGYIYKGEGQEISGGEKANVFEWRFSPIVFSKGSTDRTKNSQGFFFSFCTHFYRTLCVTSSFQNGFPHTEGGRLALTVLLSSSE